MLRILEPLFSERSVTKLAAVLPDEEQARAAAASVAQSVGLGPSQVRVLGPTLARASRRELLSRQMEPEDNAIFRTLIRAHVILGLIGALAGWLLYAWFAGSAALESTPVLGWWVFVSFGAIAGLLLGGFVSLRPDHGVVLRSIRSELAQGRWVVLVHPTEAEQVDRVEDALGRAAHGPVLRTV